MAANAKYDYTGLSREELFDIGRALVEVFCRKNKLAPPLVTNGRCNGNYGWYTSGGRAGLAGVITIDVPKTRLPTKVPGFAWTYPGYKADLTAIGVPCHELGHHVYSLLYGRIDKLQWRSILAGEPSVTKYEPNMDEAFAEAMKVFVTNPSLLREGRPERYGFIRDLGLEPIVNDSWRKVLGHAHPKFLAAAVLWIGRAR